MVANAYMKWKNGLEHWRPTVFGQPHFEAVLAVLDGLQQLTTTAIGDEGASEKTLNLCTGTVLYYTDHDFPSRMGQT